MKLAELAALSGPLPSEEVPSAKLTEPDGTPLPLGTNTVATKVTGAFVMMGLAELAKTMEVAAGPLIALGQAEESTSNDEPVDVVATAPNCDDDGVS